MSQENLEVVRRWWDGFSNTGMPPLSLCDERIEIRNPPEFPVRGSFHGHQGVRDWRDQVFEAFDNVSVEAECSTLPTTRRGRGTDEAFDAGPGSAMGSG